MKKVIEMVGIIVVLVVMNTVAFADNWTRQNTYRELAFQGLLVIDYLQTRTVVKNPDKYSERNPIMGEHPSQQSVDIYMASCAIIHPIISYLLPVKSDKWKWVNRENWQYVTIGIETVAIGNNLRIGIRF